MSLFHTDDISFSFYSLEPRLWLGTVKISCIIGDVQDCQRYALYAITNCLSHQLQLTGLYPDTKRPDYTITSPKLPENILFDITALYALLCFHRGQT